MNAQVNRPRGSSTAFFYRRLERRRIVRRTEGANPARVASGESLR
jgi:hypothetical protein